MASHRFGVWQLAAGPDGAGPAGVIAPDYRVQRPRLQIGKFQRLQQPQANFLEVEAAAGLDRGHRARLQ
jgi:hypothetical protein